MSSDGDIIEAAKYYEDKPGHTDKAVMLYHKVWNLFFIHFILFH